MGAKVKSVADEWMKKCGTLVKEWQLLDNTVTELNSWVAQDRGAEGEQNFSLEKNGVHVGRTQKHLQRKRKAGGKSLSDKKNLLSSNNKKKSTHLYIYNNNNDIMDIMLAFIL